MLKSDNPGKELELLAKLQGSDKYEDKCMITALECLRHDESLGHSKYTVGETIEILQKTHNCSEDYAVNIVFSIIDDCRRVKE